MWTRWTDIDQHESNTTKLISVRPILFKAIRAEPRLWTQFKVVEPNEVLQEIGDVQVATLV